MLLRAWVGFMVLLALCGGVRADSQLATVKKLYQSASKHYDLQDYATALDEFKQGYALKDDPVFLYNIAQCQRMLGQREPAIRSYKMFLSRSPNTPNRADVQGRIDALQGELDAQAKAAADAQAKADADAKAREDARLAASLAAQNVVVAAPPPKKTPVYKKWWLWTTVGVVVVGVGLGVGLGLGLNQPHKDAVGSTAMFN